MNQITSPSVFFKLMAVLFFSTTFTSLATENPSPPALTCSGTIVDNFPYLESFEGSSSLWTQSALDVYDWTRDANGTPSNFTGPTAANDGFFYIYTEASSRNSGDTAIITSPCFDLMNYENASIDFDYHMYGNQMGTLRMEVSNDSGTTWTQVFTQTGNQGDVWFNQTIDLSAYDGQSIQLRFFSIRGNNFRGDMAIDNIILNADLLPIPEIDIRGNSMSIVDGDTTPSVADATDFEEVVVGLNNASFFSINNIGSEDLLLTDASPYVSITGPDAAYFNISVVPNSTISGFSSTTFAVTYSPLVLGTHNATITVNSNDANESVYNFDIIGRGVGAQPEIGLAGLANNITDGDTTPSIYDGTDFGNLLVTSSITRTFQISNTGTADLLLTGPSPFVSLTGSGFFTITSIPASTIPSSGGSTTFNITYNPLIAGTHTATVSITNNDSNENPYTFDIQGLAANSLTPEIDISGQGVSIADGDTTPSVGDDTDFNTIELGNSNVNDYTISNVGTGTLTFTGTSPYVTITGPNAGQFSLETFPANNTLIAGDNTVFQIRYRPTTLGTHNATVTVLSDDITEATYNFDIRGVSINPLRQQYTIYNENFDASDGNWVASNPGGESTWTYGQNAVEPGPEGNYWYTDNYNNYSNRSDTYATSPIIDCSGYNDLRFQMDVRYNLDADVDDAMNVEYSTNGGATWTILGTTGEAVENAWYNETDADGLGNNVDGWSGNNSTSISISKSRFSRAFINLPATLHNNSQVRIRVRFGSDNATTDDGANFDNIFITGNPITLPSDPAMGPGDVTANLKTWLKASAGIAASSGSQTTLWADQATDNDAEVSDLNAPLFFNNTTENINHNPVVQFSEADKTQLKGKGGFFSKDYWIVMKQNGTINGTSGGVFEGVLAGRAANGTFSEDGSGFWTGKISNRFVGSDNMLSHMIGTTPGSVDASTRESYGRAYSSSTDSYTDEVIIINIKTNNANDETEIYKNGIKVDNVTAVASNGDVLPFYELINSSYVLGNSRAGLNRTDISSWFNGNITELISFSSANSVFDQKRIQSYLALKNGVTLHNVNSTTITRQGDENYVDSDGNIIWNVGLHSGFNFDIAGIGRDEASGLIQNQSISSNSDTILTMGLSEIYSTNSESVITNPNTITDKNFLMWGNDNRALAAAAPISVDMSIGIAGLSTIVDFTSIKKTWKVVETGTVGTVKVSIPQTSLSATLTPPGNYLMFVSDTPSFSPTSEYRILRVNGSNLETTYDFDNTKYITFGYAPEYIYERSITFDGAQDYMDADDVADLTGAFTISSWVKRDAGSNNRDILSKRNNGPYTEGYSLRLNNSGFPRMVWKDASSTTQAFNASVALPLNEWHHVAVVYDGTTAQFFIDGIEDTTMTATAPVATNQHFMIAAVDYQNPTNFFDGTLDEVRVWNDALTANQLRFIMNQEIEKFSDATVTGKIIPQSLSKNEMATIPFASLEIYLPMNKYTFTNVKDESDNNHVAAIKNLKTVDYQTAPLPYVTSADGDWDNRATWENGSEFQTPSDFSLVDPTQTVDWNIVQTKHEVTNGNYTKVLALDIQSNKLNITNDRFIEISHYFKLDGTLDLVGESQLIQTENSDFEPLSIGRLERDQQGTSDTYSYNFYSSPVSPTNPTTVNQPYSIGAVMNDGTTVTNPQALNFSGGRDGAPTSPITISAYWLYKFANTAGGNNAWQYAGPSGSIDVGLGYTMKGPGTGAITDDQNYTFIGKPNNSTDAVQIAHTIAAGNNTLVGNPFPSALFADKFIGDNGHLSGTLYFWEHWGGGSHVLAQYEGGYAMYNLSGGMPAVSHPLVSSAGVGTKIPTENIPVGQGFFVTAVADGDIVFDNSQRVFALESSGNSIFTIAEEQDLTEIDRTINNDEIDPHTVRRVDLRPKFRIGYDSPQLYHRQLLLTIDENATHALDRGYDAIILDSPKEDMSWEIEGKTVGIQGVPNVTTQSEFNLRVKTEVAGTIKIGIDQLENVNEEETVVYLKDKLLDETYNLYTGSKEVYLTSGDHKDRFSIVFIPIEDETVEVETEEEEQTEEDTDEEEGDSEETTDKEDESNQSDNEDTEEESEETDPTDENSEENGEDASEDSDEQPPTEMQVVELENSFEDIMDLNEMYASYDDRKGTILIRKNGENEFKAVRLFSMLGQVIKSWNPDVNATEIELPVLNITTGAYILDIETTHGIFTKKLIIH